jgi:hypothetical protein
VRFSQSDGKICPSRPCCTGTTRRTLTLHPKEQTQALLRARQRESTEAFKQLYRHRAGIEGTHSEACADDGLTPLAVCRFAQNAFGSCGHCCSRQRCSADGLSARRSSRTDPHLSFQTTHGAGGLRFGMTSPAVSEVAMSHPPISLSNLQTSRSPSATIAQRGPLIWLMLTLVMKNLDRQRSDL